MYRWEIFFYSLQACKYDDFLFLFLIILYFVLFYPLFVVRVKIIKMYDCIFSRAWAFLAMAVNLSERSPTTLSTLYSVLYKTAWLIFLVLFSFLYGVVFSILGYCVTSNDYSRQDREKEKIMSWDRVVFKTRNWDICVKILIKGSRIGNDEKVVD